MLKQTRTDEEKSKAEDRLLRRQDAKKRKLAELGIDYDMGDAEYVSPACRA
jgi:nucleolar protein 15